jgi:hypothetical protein
MTVGGFSTPVMEANCAQDQTCLDDNDACIKDIRAWMQAQSGTGSSLASVRPAKKSNDDYEEESSGAVPMPTCRPQLCEQTCTNVTKNMNDDYYSSICQGCKSGHVCIYEHVLPFQIAPLIFGQYT